MVTLICGSTAYQYWRTPPIVTLLAAGPSDDPMLRRLMTEDELVALRVSLLEQLPLLKACSAPRPRGGGELNSIRDASFLLAPSVTPPVDVLVDKADRRRPSSILRPKVCTSELPAGFTRCLTEEISVATPELALLQIASKASLVQTVLMASELCGSFAVYRAPAPIDDALQKLIDKNMLPALGGWQPCLSANGRLGNLWQRPALTSPQELRHVAELSDSPLGKTRLIKAADLVKPGAASPFEVQAGILLGFSRRLGGEGYGGFSHNEKAELSNNAKLLAGRDHCCCDLYWPDGLDVECQSVQFHDNSESFISNSNRTAALSLMGIHVLPLTFEQLKQPSHFDAFSSAVARALGRKQKPKTSRQLEATRKLREEVFCDWLTLPNQ